MGSIDAMRDAANTANDAAWDAYCQMTERFSQEMLDYWYEAHLRMEATQARFDAAIAALSGWARGPAGVRRTG